VIDQARSIKDEDNYVLLDKIQQTPDKKFYLALDMNLVENPLVYDDSTFPLSAKEKVPFVSSQINNITFSLPRVPLIYQYQKNPKVNN
jgi:hypothetical protein